MHIGFLYNGHQFPTRFPCVLFLKVCRNHNVAISSSFVKISLCCKFEGGPYYLWSTVQIGVVLADTEGAQALLVATWK